MHVLPKRLRLESRGFCYKVALYLSYLHIKLDDEIKGNPFEFQAYRLHSDSPMSKVKLASRFGFICSPISQLLTLVSCNKSMATNERVINRTIRTTELRFADPQNVYRLSRALSTKIYVAYE